MKPMFSYHLIPAVQYFVPKEVMPIGKEWANDDGFGNAWDGNYGFQALHRAEVNYADGEQFHTFSTWKSKDMINLEGYENDNPVNYINAWDVANAGGINNDDVNYPDPEFGESTLNDENVFPGGFHGECVSAAQWISSDSEWRCDIGSSDTETMTVSGYRLDAGSTAGKLAGFQINWSQMQKWEDAHPAAPPDGSSSGADKVKVEAMCWQGETDERPSDLSNTVKLTSQVDNGEDTYVVGELPENPDAGSENSYSCVFGMTQQVEPQYVTSGTSLFKDGSTVTGETGYITEGTDDLTKGAVTTSPESIRPSDHDPDVESMQTWLEGKEASTVSSVFQHFRGKDDISDPTNYGQQLRHPWDWCEFNGVCSVVG